jgi:hypothetical protein
MYQRWDWITVLRWRYPPEVGQALLPPGLTVLAQFLTARHRLFTVIAQAGARRAGAA